MNKFKLVISGLLFCSINVEASSKAIEIENYISDVIGEARSNKLDQKTEVETQEEKAKMKIGEIVGENEEQSKKTLRNSGSIGRLLK